MSGGASGGGAAGALQSCPLAKPPCSGLGLSLQDEVDAFAADMAKLKKDWRTLTPEQRRAAMQQAVDAATPAGMPAPNVRLDNTMAPTRNGELQFQNWDVAMNGGKATKAELTDDEFADLSGTLYHETRHGEQWYMIARRDAAEGMTADQIAQQRGIPLAVAKEAVKSPLTKIHPQRACADAMYNSVYGTGASSREATLTELGPNAAAVQAAVDKANASNAAYQRLLKNPAATPAQKAAALKQAQDDYSAWEATKKASDGNYSAYRALPEEADAWDAGDRAKTATRALLSNPAPKAK